jgi:hypothetical protein
MKIIAFLNRTMKLVGIFALLALLMSTAQAGDWPMFHHDPAHTGQADDTVEPPLELLWKYKTGDAVFSSPAVADGVVYVGSWDADAHVYALDADSGALKWKYKTVDGVFSSPAVADGVVYVGSFDNSVYALDANSGAVKWKYKTGDYVSSSPAVADGLVYVGSLDAHVYALDADSGAVKWKYETGGLVRSSPAVSDGVVYVGSGDKHVYAFATKSKIASVAITEAESTIASTNKIGADTTEAESLLNQAQTALSNKQYQDATNYVNQAKENAEKAKTVRLGLYGVLILISVIVLWITANRTKRKRKYKQKINEYQSKIEQWKSEGYNVSDLEEMLK